ncbi:hypothetical protein HA402_000697 [Bradysia odoriphaga]|nr:hypothetical protein HA402_000697 [Bradysia odoriphaga]
MNAVVALCHFCESHGPSSVFCTQTLRDSKIDEQLFNFDGNKVCSACNSIGLSLGMLSRDEESNANFLSTQTPVITEVVTLVKQAAVRSLSCEVSSNKDGGFVFFGDSARGHVLSHTFQIRDSQARGFYKLFAIVIIMKDKMFLLNIQPFLSENLTKISTILKNYALNTYKAEQSKCSERAQRLTSGQPNTQAPRSLAELTGETNIFAELHTHFTWILWAGARCLSESLTLGSPTVPPFIGRDTEEGFSLVQMDKEGWLLNKYGLDNDDDEFYSLRKCKEILRSDFVAVCYCVIVGLQVILRGPTSKTIILMKSLRKLLPESMHTLIRSDSQRYVPPTECKLLSVVPEVAVPQPCSTIFRVDFIGNDDLVSVKWTGEMPTKYPDLLTKVIKAVDEKLFTDFVLYKHLKVLVEEWKNKILCAKKVTSNQDLAKLKKILGIQQHDQMLVNYWSYWL